ncbi:MAG TPA: type II secretion system protein [Verrucomicrobiae bacterium]
MKLQVERCRLQVFQNRQRNNISTFNLQPSTFNSCRAFTMMEIAISLAVIGIALVAIIGVLPLGMRVQRDNREQTVINQDATVFIEAIRNGARGLDDLTNYVFAITNYWTKFDGNGSFVTGNNGNNGVNNGYDFNNISIASGSAFSAADSRALTSGTNIIGLLTTPEFTDDYGNPTNNLFSGGYSNHIVAYVRSISGPATEKPPQDNQLMQQDSFTYRILCVNAPVATDTNSANLDSTYTRELAANLHELRLTFEWPQQPNGSLGTGRQTYRALIAGQIVRDPFYDSLYFYQPQSFTNAP